MLREERLNHILEKLNQNQRVSAPSLMEEFKVSEGTIRRDLNELEEKGLLKKVHGGAVPRPEAPRIFDGRMRFASERKAQLAQKALAYVQDGQLILIDGGTSNWHLANLLPLSLKATVFTNSIPIVNVLMNHPHLNLHLLGGRVFKSSQVTLGTEIAEALREIRADVCFIGVRSIHHRLGITTLEQEEARIKCLMTQISDQVIVLATKDKLDTLDHYRICDYKDIDVMVVEKEVRQDVLAKYQNLGVEIIS